MALAINGILKKYELNVSSISDCIWCVALMFKFSAFNSANRFNNTSIASADVACDGRVREIWNESDVVGNDEKEVLGEIDATLDNMELAIEAVEAVGVVMVTVEPDGLLDVEQNVDVKKALYAADGSRIIIVYTKLV